MNFLTSIWSIYRRTMRLNMRNPAWLIMGASQPLLYLFFFAPLLKPLGSAMGTSDTYSLFVSGIIVMQAIFGALFAGYEIISDQQSGVLDMQKVTAAPRTALLLGRAGKDATLLVVQFAMITALGYAFGMKASLGGVILGLLLCATLGMGIACMSYALGLAVKSAQALGPIVSGFSMPILLLSGILLPLTLAPRWLDSISHFVPTRYIVDATRQLFMGTEAPITIVAGIACTFAITTIATIWGVREIRK